MLRGTGGIAVGLPLLDAMLASSAWGAAPEPPVRCFTLFFALGIPPEQVAQGFSGPLGPLAPFQDKLAFFTNVNASREGALHGSTAHVAGGTTTFTGIGGERDANFGPSLDQVVKKGAYPDGTPTPLGTLSVATYFRRNGYFKRYRCFNQDGTRAVDAFEDPRKTFQAVFGDLQNPEVADDGDPEAARKWRFERSILDTVIGEYQHFTSEASNLGQASIARLRDHLERLRELERRIFPAPGTTNNPNINCSKQQAPVAPDLPYGVDGGESGAAPLVAAADFQAAFRLNAELFVAAVRCDLVRFGSLQFESPGGHTRFSGSYELGDSTYAFKPEKSQHDAWHEGRMEDVFFNAHYMQSQMAYTLALLDDPAFPDENGQTLLANSLVVVGTETGWNHDQEGVLHACSAANGRLRVGSFYEQPMSSVDLYTTLARAIGVQATVGASQFFGGEVSGLINS
jgi:hypothetical protein